MPIWFNYSFSKFLPFTNRKNILFKIYLQLWIKNAASNNEQVLKATLHTAAVVRLFTTNHKMIQVRHAGHCWGSRDELKSGILQWTLSHGLARTGRPARTYIQLLFANTGCSLEDVLGAIDDKEGWQERVRKIHAGATTWWWWFMTHILWDWKSLSCGRYLLLLVVLR